jgi:steroid delta-isomerase-like uncharacterized protein
MKETAMTIVTRLARIALVAAALAATGPALANEAQNKDVVGIVGDSVFNKHDFSLLEQYMTEDYIQHNPLVPQGREGFRQFFEATFQGVPDWSYDLTHIAADGDLVWVHGTYSGTHEGEWLGIPGTGKAFAIAAVDIFRVEDGKLAEHWDVMDVYGLFSQLGVIAP